MNSRERQALDRYITGNWGEDQFKGDDYCEACGEEVANRECAHGILCSECDKEVHGAVGAPCDIDKKEKTMNTIHTAESPFPLKTKSGLVVDEMCYCGHKRSEHADTAAFGHGVCMASIGTQEEQDAGMVCNCNKYTWRNFIYEG